MTALEPADGSPAPRRRAPAPGRVALGALALSLPVLAYLILVSHALVPGRVLNLPVALSYSGLTQCLAERGGLFNLSCPLVGSPLGFIPLSDGPYLRGAAHVSRLTGASALAAMNVTRAVLVLASFAALVALQRRLGIERWIAVLAAFAYLQLPLLLLHAGIHAYYVGILAMPIYLLADCVVFSVFASARERPGKWRPAAAAAGYLAVRVLSLFQDPYTAVMHVTVSGVGLAFTSWSLVSRREHRTAASLVLVWVASIAVAVRLYQGFVPGGAEYEVASIDFFRAQGVDLVSLITPSHRLWWAEAAGVGVEAWNAHAYFGDGSNVSGNYLGIVMLLSVAAYGIGRRRQAHARARLPSQQSLIWTSLLAAAALCGLLALGPSLKIGDTRAPGSPTRFGVDDYLMPAPAATLTLPHERLFVSLPGLENMRAIYRWIAVPQLVLILLFAWVVSRLEAKRRGWGFALALLGFAELQPNYADVARSTKENRAQHDQFEQDVLASMERAVVPGERVFFLSAENDYLVNYLAPKLGIYSYNVGGDKNFGLSSALWPPSLLPLWSAAASPAYPGEAVAAALRVGDVEAVVIPYFNLRWAAYAWPPAVGEPEEDRRRWLRTLESEYAELGVTGDRWFAVARRGEPHSSVPRARLLTDPNPIVVCDGSEVGRTRVYWRAADARQVEIRVGSATGKLITRTGPRGSIQTDRWVRDGTEIHLSESGASGPPASVAAVTVRLTTAGCPPD